MGATRGHLRWQFLTESLLLATFGGLGGLILGFLATAGYARYQEIVDQHYAAASYRNVKRWLADRE